MPTKRVLYYYSSQQFDTGSPKSLHSMICALNRQRFEPLFLATGAGPLVDALRQVDVEILDGTVESISYRRPLRAIGRIRAQAALLRKHRIDVLHVNEVGWNLDLVFAARRCRIPVLLHMHNPQRIDTRNANRILASKVLICSEKQKEDVPNFSLIANKCDVLYNTVDTDTMAGGKSIRPELGLDEGDIVVGTIAQICFRKGIDILLDTARACIAEHDNLHFLIIGPPAVGEERYADDMRARIGDTALDGRVHLLGSRRDIPDLLASMDIFFLPTRAEPFGIVVVEAMAAGLPVVVSRVGGVPEIVHGDDIGLTVSPVEAAGFAGAIGRVVAMGAARRSLGERGRASILGRFDSETIGHRLQDIYAEVLAG